MLYRKSVQVVVKVFTYTMDFPPVLHLYGCSCNVKRASELCITLSLGNPFNCGYDKNITGTLLVSPVAVLSFIFHRLKLIEVSRLPYQNYSCALARKRPLPCLPTARSYFSE